MEFYVLGEKHKKNLPSAPNVLNHKDMKKLPFCI